MQNAGEKNRAPAQKTDFIQNGIGEFISSGISCFGRFRAPRPDSEKSACMGAQRETHVHKLSYTQARP